MLAHRFPSDVGGREPMKITPPEPTLARIDFRVGLHGGRQSSTLLSHADRFGVRRNVGREGTCRGARRRSLASGLRCTGVGRGAGPRPHRHLSCIPAPAAPPAILEFHSRGGLPPRPLTWVARAAVTRVAGGPDCVALVDRTQWCISSGGRKNKGGIRGGRVFHRGEAEVPGGYRAGILWRSTSEDLLSS